MYRYATHTQNTCREMTGEPRRLCLLARSVKGGDSPGCTSIEEALDAALVAPVLDDVVALAVAAQEDLDDHERSLPQQHRIYHYRILLSTYYQQ